MRSVDFFLFYLYFNHFKLFLDSVKSKTKLSFCLLLFLLEILLDFVIRVNVNLGGVSVFE